MSRPLTFTGTAHPPAKAVRDHPSDLSAGELLATQANGLPVHVEHDTSLPSVGHVLTSFEGTRGEMRVIGQVTDPEVARKVQSGKLRGLSLGTDCVADTSGGILSRYQKELSLCEEGRRAGTWITHIDGKQVHQVHAFSKKGMKPALK